LRHRARVRIHHGAAEVLGRVVLLDRDQLEPGDAAPVQLRLEQPLAAERGDHIVLRFYSPMRTLGGARVLDPAPPKHKRFRDDVLQAIQLQESGDPLGLVHDAVRQGGAGGRGRDELERARTVPQEALGGLLDQLVRAGRIVQAGEAFYDRGVLARLRADLCRLAGAHQQANPLAWGIGRAELQERLGHRGSRARFAALLEHLAAHPGPGGAESIHLRPDAVRVGAAERELSDRDRAALVRLESVLRAAGTSPPTVPELQKEGFGDRLAAYVSVLEEQGAIVRITESFLYHATVLAEITAKLHAFLRTRDVMTMADFKDMGGISRKYAVPLLEFFDRKGVTARAGDVRKPGPVVQRAGGAGTA
jgi:selenocysteine-specific elongation factor